MTYEARAAKVMEGVIMHLRKAASVAFGLGWSVARVS